MPNYQTRNVIVGAAALYIGASDSSVGGYTTPALPAAPAAGVSFTSALDGASGWRSVGFTTDGLELTYAPDYADIEVDQLLDSAKIFKQSLRVTLATTLTEASLDNLIVSWGRPTADVSSTTSDAYTGIASGALGDEPVERALSAVGPAPRSTAGAKRERVYYARRVLSVESSAHAMRRNEATVFPVSFRLLPDTTQPAGSEYGTIRDRNI